MLRTAQYRVFRNLRKASRVIRWRMLAILVFFGVFSTILIAAFSVAVVNVVVRRESSYLIEERIKTIVENDTRLNVSALKRIDPRIAPVSSFDLITGYLSAIWPESRTAIGTASRKPQWLRSASFTGMVADRGRLAIRSYHEVQRDRCAVGILADTPITGPFLEQLSKATGVALANDQPVLLYPYRASEGIWGEIAANFIPGSRGAIPVVIIARNWQTGAREDWVLCQVRLNYRRTIEDLSHMGLQPASWVAPFGTITLGLLLVYACGLVLSIRLSQRIGSGIDHLNRAALRVGKGDFSVRVSIPGKDQLGMLASAFNGMTSDLQALREQEKQTAVLERDLALAREVQERLYPRTVTTSRGVTLWGVNTPARAVSGDLYEFFTFSPHEVGLLCADVSGKGVSAALMMAHLQALVHGRLLALDETGTRPAPGPFIRAINRDFYGRFGNNRYTTMFYGEFDSRSKVLRYINAGHCPAILISETGEANKLSGGDLPVGLFPQTSYQTLQTNLSAGCAIIVYTDGVTDALNLQGEEFGEERLLRCCRSLPKGATGEVIGTLISKKVAEWADDVEQFDDITILVLAVE